MGISGDLAREYCERFSHAKTKTLANLMYEENPGVWSNKEAARTAIRSARGAQGKILRERDKRHGRDDLHQELGVSGSPFSTLPEPITQILDPRAVEVDAERTLILSDIHIPFHDADVLEKALAYGEARSVDCVILDGDYLDCNAVSRWVKDPRERDFPREIDATKQFLRHVRERFPKARIIAKDGNHEDRWEIYMFTRAPELLGMSDLFELHSVLKFKDLGIERLTKHTHARIGNLNVLHGHEFGRGGGVNPARWLFLRAGKNAIIGHFHRTSEHAEANMEGALISCWSMGALCQLRQSYAPYNKWGHGFAFVEAHQGKFRVENLRFVDGEIY